MKIAIVTEITLVGNSNGIESVKNTAFDTIPKAFEFMMDAYMEKMSNGDVFNDEYDDNHVLIVTNDDTLYSAYLNVVEVQSGEVCASTIATKQ